LVDAELVDAVSADGELVDAHGVGAEMGVADVGESEHVSSSHARPGRALSVSRAGGSGSAAAGLMLCARRGHRPERRWNSSTISFLMRPRSAIS
jgi:hypothetical protein